VVDPRGFMNIPKERRELVRRRANESCEYCRLPQAASLLPHHVDHIIASQHGGADDDDNLCLCCIRCNLKKGPNIASIDPESHVVVALFHPRRQVWLEHFVFDSDTRIKGRTAEGRATANLLGMNDAERLSLRRTLVRGGGRSFA
jgi:hypothetical protein